MALSLTRLLRFGASAMPTAVAAEHSPRPKGDVIWMHATNSRDARSLLTLAASLIDDDLCSVLVTCTEPVEPPSPLSKAKKVLVFQPTPPDTPQGLAQFLDHWDPRLLIIAGGILSFDYLTAFSSRKRPVFVVNGRVPMISGGSSWLPWQMRRVVAPVIRVLALDDPAARAFRKAGVALVQTGRLEEVIALPGVDEHERDLITRQLSARPLWLASCPPIEEIDLILTAHQTALQRSHRLLLILQLADQKFAEDLDRKINEEYGWSVARHDKDDLPDTETDVFLMTTPEDTGLGLRLAPLCFLGGSLLGEGPLRNPMEPAAFGASVLHGPKVGVWGAEIGRLGAARGAVAVSTGQQLADAVIELLAPDVAAKYAAAAWSVASEGAEATVELVADIQRVLDQRQTP